MKALVISGLLISFIGCRAQEVPFAQIQSKVKWFISEVKDRESEQSKYNIYLVSTLLKHDSLCLVMSYLSDSITLIGITDYKYSFFLGEDLVLIRFDKVASRTYKTAITKMSVLSNISSLYRRLYDGVVLGASYGCISYYNGGNNKTIFYDDSDDIPDKLSNINYYPLGQIVELDSLSLEFLLSRGRAKTKK